MIEGGISYHEIGEALQAHDFSTADPRINFWVNRCQWLLEQNKWIKQLNQALDERNKELILEKKRAVAILSRSLR